MGNLFSIQSGNWSSPATWAGGRVPTQADTATVSTGHTVKLDQNAAVGVSLSLAALTVESGATLTTDPATTWTLTLLGHLQCNGDLSPGAGGALIIVDGVGTVTYSVAGGYRVRVELRDKTNVLKYVFAKGVGNPQGTLMGASWVYSRIGGDYSASILVRAPLEGYVMKDLIGYDIQIVLEPATGPTLWWQGQVRNAGQTLGEADTLRIEASGWVMRLERISVVSLGFPIESGAVVFENQDASVIAKALIDRAKPWTGITYTGASVTDPIGFTIRRISFNGSIYAALHLIAQIAGNAEWGVKGKTFWLKAKSANTKHIFVPGKDVKHFEQNADSQGMVNRIHLNNADLSLSLENNADMVVDQQQSTNTHTIPFGQLTTYQKVMQRITPVEPTLSVVEVAVSKTGFTNLVADGTMEAADVLSWDQLLTSYTQTPTKDTAAPHGGTRCLRINQIAGANRYGVYQDVTVTAQQNYRLECWVATQLEEVMIELVDGTGANWSNTIIAQQKATLPGWNGFFLSGATSASVTTLGIRFYAYNKKAGDHPFWVDDVSLIAGDANVEIAILRDNGAGVWETVVSNTIAFSEIPTTTPGAISKSLIVPYIDLDNLATRPYAIQLQSLGTRSDSSYFLLGRDNAGGSGYAEGTLRYWNGASWITETAGDAYFKTKLPNSQKIWGMHSEVMSVPGLSDPSDAQLWANSVIAGRQEPIVRGVVVSENWDTMLESAIPVDRLRVQGPMLAGASVEKITYTDTEKGLRVQAEFGAVLPKIADLLANLEHKIGQG